MKVSNENPVGNWLGEANVATELEIQAPPGRTRKILVF